MDLITQLLTTYRYQTEFIMMFGGLGILGIAIWLDHKYGDKWWHSIIAIVGTSILFIGFLLCMISIYVNGAD